MRHLGDSQIKDWPGFAEKPEGTNLVLNFNATANPGPATLQLRQRDIDGVWHLKINGREIAELQRKRKEADCYYEITAGLLKDGVNTLELSPDNTTDDIGIGHFTLHLKPLREQLNLKSLVIKVTDADTGRPIPARVSLESAEGSAPELYYTDSSKVAARDGLIYVKGESQVELVAGNYRIAATRGMEWSRDEQTVELSNAAKVELRLRREVDTSGFVAADTHIHTFEFSGHGDATAAERVLSLAGEGIELAVATDHNHNTDYRPFQERMQLNDFFTPVTGNEVTTDNGHFNGFPLRPGDAVPPYKETDWVKVVEGIRLKGAQVVILNHPRWPDLAQSPFTRQGLNRATGDRADKTRFTFDAMELVNSTVDTKDPMYLFVDWFGLLNAGERISAVGSSDTHAVGDPVGQGRTYLPSGTDEPAKLQVDELCAALLKGRASVSLGIFATVTVDEKFTSGDLVPVQDAKVAVRVRVATASWIRPRKATLYLNGVPVAEQEISSAMGHPTDAKLNFVIPTKGVDAHLVCVVLGDPVTAHGWKTLNDYTLAATNPVFLDVNGDASYRSPRESAQRVLASLEGDLEAMINTLDVIPPYLGVQVLALGHQNFKGKDLERLDAALKALAEREPTYSLYLRHLPKPATTNPAAATGVAKP